MCRLTVHCYWLFGLSNYWSNISSGYELNLSYTCSNTLIDFPCLFWTEIFGHIRHTLFSDDGVPNEDMRTLAYDKFKAVGVLMAYSLIQEGGAYTLFFVFECVWLSYWWHGKRAKWGVGFNHQRGFPEAVNGNCKIFTTVYHVNNLITMITKEKRNILALREAWKSQPGL